MNTGLLMVNRHMCLYSNYPRPDYEGNNGYDTDLWMQGNTLFHCTTSYFNTIQPTLAGVVLQEDATDQDSISARDIVTTQAQEVEGALPVPVYEERTIRAVMNNFASREMRYDSRW